MMSKVIYCISSIDLAAGGPSRSMPTLCIGMKDVGVDCEIRTFASPNPNDSMLRKYCIPIYYVERPKSLKERLFENPLAIGEENSDIVCHIQNIWDPSLHWVAKSCIKNNIPYIISPRGMLESWSLSQKWIKKRLALTLYQKADLENASCIHTTAESEKASVRNLGIKSPIAVIPNGINIADYGEREYETIHDRRRRLLFLSRIHPKKGIDILLESWSEIPEYLRNEWELVIAGEGDESYSLDDLNRLITEKYPTLGVIVAGPQYGEDKTKLYQSADLFVLPTHSENFGMVIAEAMCCGVPVITTTGTPWIELREQNLGWYIDLSIDNLKQTIMDAISRSDSERFEMGKNSRQWVIAHYSIEAVAHKYRTLYSWLLGCEDKPEFVYTE